MRRVALSQNHNVSFTGVRVRRNIVGIITEPCKETNYRYEVDVHGNKRATDSLPNAVLLFDEMTDYGYCAM